jgi:hypothetical protein
MNINRGKIEWNRMNRGQTPKYCATLKDKEGQERSELKGNHQLLFNADVTGLLGRRINDIETQKID